MKNEIIIEKCRIKLYRITAQKKNCIDRHDYDYSEKPKTIYRINFLQNTRCTAKQEATNSSTTRSCGSLEVQV